MSRRKAASLSEKLDNFVTLWHAQMGHPVECCTADKDLGGLCFQQASRKFIAKDGFHAKHGSFCQRTDMIARIVFPGIAPMFANVA